MNARVIFKKLIEMHVIKNYFFKVFFTKMSLSFISVFQKRSEVPLCMWS